MTAVAAKTDAVGLMVLEWQTTPSELARRNLGNAIMRALQPLIRKVASRFSTRARGSLSIEDLEQVASIEAFKRFSRFDPATGTTFEHEVYWSAKNACKQQVELHSTDVRPSLHLQRSAKGQGTDSYKGRKVETECRIESRDAFFLNQTVEGTDRPSKFADPEDQTQETPEKQLDDAQTSARLRRALNKLTPERRKLVIEYYGIGRSGEESLRSIAARQDRSRSRLASELEGAIGDLREAML